MIYYFLPFIRFTIKYDKNIIGFRAFLFLKKRPNKMKESKVKIVVCKPHKRSLSFFGQWLPSWQKEACLISALNIPV